MTFEILWTHWGWTLNSTLWVNLYPSNFFVHRERVYSVDSIHSAALDWSWDREPWQGCSSTRPGTSSFPNMTLLSKSYSTNISILNPDQWPTNFNQLHCIKVANTIFAEHSICWDSHGLTLALLTPFYVLGWSKCVDLFEFWLYFQRKSCIASIRWQWRYRVVAMMRWWCNWYKKREETLDDSRSSLLCCCYVAQQTLQCPIEWILVRLLCPSWNAFIRHLPIPIVLWEVTHNSMRRTIFK